MAAPNLIGFLDSIMVNGVNLLVDEEAEKAYAPFVINRGVAQSISTVLYAQEMNKRPGLTKEMHYSYLRKVIPKKKRYDKWPKKKDLGEDIQTIQAYYHVSVEKAQEYASILTDEQIAIIKTRMDTGGQRKAVKSTK